MGTSSLRIGLVRVRSGEVLVGLEMFLLEFLHRKARIDGMGLARVFVFGHAFCTIRWVWVM